MRLASSDKKNGAECLWAAGGAGAGAGDRCLLQRVAAEVTAVLTQQSRTAVYREKVLKADETFKISTTLYLLRAECTILNRAQVV